MARKYEWLLEVLDDEDEIEDSLVYDSLAELDAYADLANVLYDPAHYRLALIVDATSGAYCERGFAYVNVAEGGPRLAAEFTNDYDRPLGIKVPKKYVAELAKAAAAY